MKHRLMMKGREMEKGIMFFFPNDDSSRQLQGCMNKNTLVLNNASCYIYYELKKERSKYRLEVKDQNDKLLKYEYFKDNSEESKDKPHFNVNQLLSEVINKKGK